MHFPTAHTTALDEPVVDHWLERKIGPTANASAVQDQSDDRTIYGASLPELCPAPNHLMYQVNCTNIAPL